jgi:thiol:disulfide interchange protein DsbC
MANLANFGPCYGSVKRSDYIEIISMIRTAKIIAVSLLMGLWGSAAFAQPVVKTAKAAAPTTAANSDAVVRAAVAKLIPNTPIDSIKASVIPGYREVAMGSRIFYVSSDGKYFIQGSIFDLTSRTSVTEKSQAAIRKTILASVGPERRIIFSPPNPKHRLTVFTDIDCGFCRKMHQQIADYNKLGISVEYLFYPRAGVASDSATKAISVWCSADRRKAMTDAKNERAVPKKTCTNPIAADYALGQKVGFDGTPAAYASNGQQVGGYLPPAQMLAALEAAGK